MIGLTPLMIVMFYTINGMMKGGINVGLSMVTAALEVMVGVIIVRAMYRAAQ